MRAVAVGSGSPIRLQDPRVDSQPLRKFARLWATPNDEKKNSAIATANPSGSCHFWASPRHKARSSKNGSRAGLGLALAARSLSGSPCASSVRRWGYGRYSEPQEGSLAVLPPMPSLRSCSRQFPSSAGFWRECVLARDRELDDRCSRQGDDRVRADTIVSSCPLINSLQ